MHPQRSEKVDNEKMGSGVLNFEVPSTMATNFSGSDATFGISCRTEAGADAKILVRVVERAGHVEMKCSGVSGASW